MRNIFRYGAVAVSFLGIPALLGACGKGEPSFGEGLMRSPRVAVLPFKAAADEPEHLTDEFREGVGLIRQGVYVNLKSTSFRMVDLSKVDEVLAENGWADVSAMENVDAARLGEALESDLLVFGEVKKWGRVFALVHSHVTGEASIRLVDGRTGSNLYQNSEKKRWYFGILGVPTGYSAPVTGAVAGYRKGTLYKLTNDLTRDLTLELVSNSPWSLEEITPPRIDLVAHSFQAGAALHAEDVLTVLALGEPGQNAMFSIGTFKDNIPMSEFESGRYVGRYKVEIGDFVKRAKVVVFFENPAGGGRNFEVISDPLVRINARLPAKETVPLDFESASEPARSQ